MGLLIDDWKDGWRLWSVRFAAVIGVVPELLYRLATAAEHLLPTLSYVVVDNLPPWLRGTAAVLALMATLLRLLKQPPKGPPPRDDFGYPQFERMSEDRGPHKIGDLPE